MQALRAMPGEMLTEGVGSSCLITGRGAGVHTAVIYTCATRARLPGFFPHVECPSGGMRPTQALQGWAELWGSDPATGDSESSSNSGSGLSSKFTGPEVLAGHSLL